MKATHPISSFNTKYGKDRTPFFHSHHRRPCKKFYKRQKSQEKLVQFHHLYTASLVQPSPASSDLTATQTNSNSTLSSTTLKSEEKSPSKFSSKLGLRNQLVQLSGLRIFYLTTTISKITTKTQLTTFALLDSINHQANYTQGNYNGTSKIQFNFQFHCAYSFHNLIVNKYILYH